MPISPLRPAVSEKTRARVLKDVSVFGFCALIFFLFLFVLFSDEGLVTLYRTRTEHRGVRAELDVARRENERLLASIESLKHDPAAVEGVAREKLRMTRPGEKIFLFIEPERE